MKRLFLFIAMLGVITGSLCAKTKASKTSIQKKDINLIFIGNSITAGVTLEDASTQAPSIVCRDLIEQSTGISTHVYNGGHSGITTFGFLPGRTDLTKVIANAKSLISENSGALYFSIMLGTNDSAIKGTEGAPVNPDTYQKNMRSIICELIENFPDCKIIVNYPIWYSPNTHNGACYLQEGLERLHSYPIIDGLDQEYKQVWAGNRNVWEFFQDNYQLFTAEEGNSGTFFLHPNKQGATYLAEIWAESLLAIIQKDGTLIKEKSQK